MTLLQIMTLQETRHHVYIILYIMIPMMYTVSDRLHDQYDA